MITDNATPPVIMMTHEQQAAFLFVVKETSLCKDCTRSCTVQDAICIFCTGYAKGGKDE